MNDSQDNKKDEVIEQILSRLGNRPRPDDRMTEAVRANVMQAWQEEVKRSKRGGYLRMAAAVGALAAGGFIATMIDAPRPVPVATLDRGEYLNYSVDGDRWQALEDDSVIAGYYLRTDDAAYASLTFESGMNLRLNEGTIVRIEADDGISLRRGEVYLDSNTMEAADGFTVNTEFGSATDIGTQFMVRTSVNDWSVQVRDGLVNVNDDDHSLAVSPGQKLTLSAANEVTTLELAPFDASWQWAEAARPPYDLDGKTVDDYLHWVARETGRTVRFLGDSDQQMARKTRLGGFQSIDSLSATETLPHVLQTTDLRLIELTDHSITIGVQTGE